MLIARVLPAMGPPPWLTLTVAGLTMGMMLFMVAAGLTLIFGLMEVLNFAHAAFVTVGAYIAVSVLVGRLPAGPTRPRLRSISPRCWWRWSRPRSRAARSASCSSA